MEEYKEKGREEGLGGIDCGRLTWDRLEAEFVVPSTIRSLCKTKDSNNGDRLANLHPFGRSANSSDIL